MNPGRSTTGQSQGTRGCGALAGPSQRRGRPGWRILGLLVLAACGPPLQDGLSHLPIGQDVSLALGRQRLLIPVDPNRHYRAHLQPDPGDFALLVASLCTLDPHQRVDEGDSHCLDQAVVVGPEGSSEVEVAAPERRFNTLVLRVYSEGSSAGPVTLRIDAD